MPADAMKRIIAAIEQVSGLDLGQRTAELALWLRSRNVSSQEAALDAFAEQLTQKNSALRSQLVRRFTVSHTRFFRDSEQLHAIRSALAALDSRPLRLWSAGCSTGEEAYTVALLCREFRHEVEIVASDINGESLAQARAGCYAREMLSSVPQKYHDDFVSHGELVELSPRVRRRLSFVEHSLTEAPLLPQDAAGWDLILCRNVLIYFRPEISAKALEQLASAVLPGGYVVLGASEFHVRSKELVSTRIGERILLQRPTAGQREPAPAAQVYSAPPAAPPSGSSAPLSADTPMSLAMRLFSGKIDAVLAETLPTLMRNPEAQPALLLSGIAYHLKRRHREAAALLERALRQHPSCWPAAYFLATSLEALERREDARDVYLALSNSGSPTPAAQALIELLNLQPWKSEAMALARRRLFDSQTGILAPREPPPDIEKGKLHAVPPTKGPHRR